MKTKTKNDYKSGYEEKFSYRIIDKIIKPGFAHHFEYEKPVWYLGADGKKKCFHPDFIIYGKTDQLRIAVEIDGKQHQRKDAMVNDAMRDATLRDMGYFVLRFTTDDMNNYIESCIETIKRALKMEESLLIETAQLRKLYQFRQKEIFSDHTR